MYQVEMHSAASSKKTSVLLITRKPLNDAIKTLGLLILSPPLF